MLNVPILKMEHQYKTITAKYNESIDTYCAIGQDVNNILDNKTEWLDFDLNYYPEDFVPEILNEGYQLVSVTENPGVYRTYHFIK